MRNPIRKIILISTLIRASIVAIVCMGVFGFALIQDRAASSQGGRRPVMRVSEKIIELGTVDPWEMVEQVFTIFNDGERVLRIERVSPD
jgi:hypothetical protein